MREENQLRNILGIIENYKLDVPLQRYLKEYYRLHRNMGGRDRRQASEVIYNYFRLGKSLADLRPAERIAVAGFLCSSSVNPLLSHCLQKYSLLKEEDVTLPVNKKIELIRDIYPSFSLEKIFPFEKYISAEVDKNKFLHSLLVQPKVWIRIRKKYFEDVISELKEKNISFEEDTESPLTISFAGAPALTNLASYEKGYFEIQDWSSQQMQKYFHPLLNESWWDACAGSGGKSLMLYEIESSVNIIATDVRPSILENLKERFRKAGVKDYKSHLLDLSIPTIKHPSSNTFNNIIADVPCTGSGTWSRTPEWLTMFDEGKIKEYQSLQRKIIFNLIPFLKPGGRLIYITCSVFDEENEANMEFIRSKASLTLQESAYVQGSAKGADMMYVAIFVKN